MTTSSEGPQMSHIDAVEIHLFERHEFIGQYLTGTVEGVKTEEELEQVINGPGGFIKLYAESFPVRWINKSAILAIKPKRARGY